MSGHVQKSCLIGIQFPCLCHTELRKFIQVPEFRLKAFDEVNVSVDGEVNPFTEAEIKMIPGAINFVVPEGSEMI